MDTIKQAGNSFYFGEEHDRIAEVTFVPTGKNQIIIDHTFVNEDARGRGLGDELVFRVADYARENDKKIIPLCPFAKRIMEQDESYHDVLK